MTTGIVPVARGPVRLVIDMPARSARPLIGAVFLSSFMFVVGALEWSALSAVLPPSPSSMTLGRPVLTAALLGLVVFFSVVWFTRVGAAREILEIDSRFVTVARGKSIVAVLPRALSDFSLREMPSTGLDAWISRHFHEFPHFRFGSHSGWLIPAGSGISRAAAERLAGSIREFMDEHPAEEGFNYGKPIFIPG